MKNYTNELEKLFTLIESYSKTSIKLYKYTTVYKSANILSSLSVKFVLALLFLFFFFFLNIGIAIYLGEYLHKIYYGFFIVAGFYILIALLFLVFKDALIKTPVCNFIISATLNTDHNDSHEIE
ncbi:hypothetical protein [Flavobacterium luteum]|uniref:Phage holin family protein n=1 Tax=Flavobacterium luteum TaxID=2026654 RepID=A0A7J5AJC8_9FLAO|nr:hypothetical protein [Flavobacterium luteum]KAB1157722.1 hypothetical protein F6464_01160 [Flavobacterium luteum]